MNIRQYRELTWEQRICLLILIVDMFLVFPLVYLGWFRYSTMINYPMAKVIEPFWNVSSSSICTWGHLIVVVSCIAAYCLKKRPAIRICMLGATVVFVIMIILGGRELIFLNNAVSNFNPATVQSTMVEIDLQQLYEMSQDDELAMIYFGRPSCTHCEEIKPNLDILINNSHSQVYYYNTERDRNDNAEEMQSVLEIYGIDSLPSLVVWKGNGEKEIYADEQMIEYFMDTERFDY